MAFSDTFKALADPVRREILTLLKKGRMPAGEIAANFGLTGATVSYHLSLLKKAGLIYEAREKNYIYYDLNTSVVEEVMLWLSELRGVTDMNAAEDPGAEDDVMPEVGDVQETGTDIGSCGPETEAGKEAANEV